MGKPQFDMMQIKTQGHVIKMKITWEGNADKDEHTSVRGLSILKIYFLQFTNDHDLVQ